MKKSKPNLNKTAIGEKIDNYNSNKKINVLFLLSGSYLFPVPRIHIMAEALVKSGYNVNIICSDKQLSKFQIINGVKVWNVFEKEEVQRSKYFKFLDIKKRIEKKCNEFHPDIIQFFSPLLIPLCITLKLKSNSKLIYDCYEYWIGSALTSKRYLLALVYAFLHFFVFLYLNGIIFVYENNPTSHVIDFFNKHFRKNKIFKCVIYNVPQDKIIPTSTNKSLKYELFNDKNTFIVGYLGLVMKYKGYIETIKSLKYLDDKYKLLIVGDFIDSKFKNTLNKLIDKYNLRSRIVFTGLLSHDKAMEYTSTFDIGLLLFEDSPWTRYSLPNKLFEYIALGIPIIASNLPNFKFFMNKNYCGVISSNHPRRLSEKIVGLGGNKDLLEKIGKYNKKIFKEKYSEDIQIQKLLKLYSIISKELVKQGSCYVY